MLGCTLIVFEAAAAETVRKEGSRERTRNQAVASLVFGTGKNEAGKSVPNDSWHTLFEMVFEMF